VTNLVAAGPTLLQRSEDFQRLLRSLRGESAIGQGVGMPERVTVRGAHPA